MSTAVRPAKSDYAHYYERYIGLVPEGDVVSTLEAQLTETQALLRSISESKAGHRYEEGKWSIKELVGHVLDTERIFSYRALTIARGDTTPLPGFDQDAYAPEGGFDDRTLGDLADELGHVRRATISLFKTLPEKAWSRAGVANDNAVTVRAIAYIIAGHERAHLDVLRERYL